MKITLRTDFRDFYDHWFDSVVHPAQQQLELNHVILNRVSTEGLSKRQQFKLLDDVGFATPLHGIVKSVCENTTNQYLVVYTDEMVHRGEGKLLLKKEDAAAQYPDHYCSVFVPSTDDPLNRSVSRRLLAVGDRLYWLRYSSDGWQSNVGEASVTVVSQTHDRRAYALEGELDFDLLRQYPLFAIDFVESQKRQQLMAIDFNNAPGMKHTGMDEVMSPAEVVGVLTEYFQKQKFRNPKVN